MNPGDNPPVGIVLCAEKNDAVVRYTLPEDEKQVFAAQYMTYLPTQEELQTLLQGRVTTTLTAYEKKPMEICTSVGFSLTS